MVYPQVIPKYFKHSNYSSFVRQLNMYNFHKTVANPQIAEFHHPYFQRDRADMLHLVKRKLRNAAKEYDEEDEEHEATAKHKAYHGEQQAKSHRHNPNSPAWQAAVAAEEAEETEEGVVTAERKLAMRTRHKGERRKAHGSSSHPLAGRRGMAVAPTGYDPVAPLLAVTASHREESSTGALVDNFEMEGSNSSAWAALTSQLLSPDPMGPPTGPAHPGAAPGLAQQALVLASSQAAAAAAAAGCAVPHGASAEQRLRVVEAACHGLRQQNLELLRELGRWREVQAGVDGKLDLLMALAQDSSQASSLQAALLADSGALLAALRPPAHMPLTGAPLTVSCNGFGVSSTLNSDPSPRPPSNEARVQFEVALSGDNESNNGGLLHKRAKFDVGQSGGGWPIVAASNATFRDTFGPAGQGAGLGALTQAAATVAQTVSLMDADHVSEGSEGGGDDDSEASSEKGDGEPYDDGAQHEVDEEVDEEDE